MDLISLNTHCVVALKTLRYVVLFIDGGPEVASEGLCMPRHHVERLIEHFLLGEEHFVDVDGRDFAMVLILVVGTLDFVKLYELVSD